MCSGKNIDILKTPKHIFFIETLHITKGSCISGFFLADILDNFHIWLNPCS